MVQGAFAQAFFEHEERFKDDIAKVQTWRTALREVANLKGWHLLDRFEAQLIQDIVGEIWKKLNYAFFEDTEDLVGIKSRVKHLESCLAIGSNDVRIIGVLGMGGIDEICEAEALTDDEALHLLSLKAFKKDHPPEGYVELSIDVVEYTKGLPLAIQIMGSFLFSRSINQWKSTLIRIKEFLERAIHQALKISYDGLHETEKKIFLYIACFFNHEDKNSVVKKLDYLGLYPAIGLEVLASSVDA
ncbi:hypothetical protein SO802_005105 [Lithocarpus litseifolius]|uniref:TIR domain-containing protein n=1 Tax=Lithocarpus litseifolius TaxID=425828 RepID=A0AAW2DH85_9ROSI